MAPKRIGFIAFDDIVALDLVGPLEAFTSAGGENAGGENAGGYETLVIGASNRSIRAESGLQIKADTTLDRAPPLDTIFLPGGSGLRDPKTSRAVVEFLRARAPKTRRIAAACTGVYGLAASGLLDGRRVTTHWRFAEDVAEKFPTLEVDPDAIYLKDGQFYTSAGVTAAIDLALALIEEDRGRRAALAVARELVVYLRRSGGQEQYSEPLQFQTETSDDFGDLAAWIAGHLDEDLSVETLAERAHFCPRHFARRFKAVFATTPAAFVEGLRLDEARRRLSQPNSSVAAVSSSVGFASADAFRRAFHRRFGVSPADYRARFPAPRAGDERLALQRAT